MKPTAKKTAPKKSANSTEEKNSLNKEEIKEIVEETVEEVLKEKADEKEVPPVDEKEKNRHPELDSGSPEIADQVRNDVDGGEKSSASGSAVGLPTGTSPASETPEKGTATTMSSNDEKSSQSAEVTMPQTQMSENASVTDEKKETAAATPIVTVSAPTPMEAPSGFIGNPADEPQKKSPLLGILIAVFAFLLAAGGGFWYLSSHHTLMNDLKLPGFAPTATPSPNMQSPTPTIAQKQIDVSSYKVSVLNGSGVAGEAAKVKDLLAGVGFTVDNIGNATSSDYTQTVISAKSSVSQDAIDKLMQVLAGSYTVSTHPVTLSASDPEDIVVTVGAAK